MSKTFTTGQATLALGFMVTGKFIQSMGLTPATTVKGNPIWNLADWELLKGGIIKHVAELSPPGDKPTPAPKPKAVASPAAPAPYSDDEDEL